MKTISHIYRSILFALCMVSILTISAQEADSQEKAKDADRKRDIERAEQLRAEMALEEMEQARKMAELQQKKAMQEYEIQQRTMAKQAEMAAKEMEYRARALSFGDQNTSQLMLSKSYDGTKKSENSGVFNVDESVKNIKYAIDGSVRSGSIKIQLILPDGDIYKELNIDESADIRYSQTLNISEETKKYMGNWKYKIKVVDADGSYRLSINTH